MRNGMRQRAAGVLRVLPDSISTCSAAGIDLKRAVRKGAALCFTGSGRTVQKKQPFRKPAADKGVKGKETGLSAGHCPRVIFARRNRKVRVLCSKKQAVYPFFLCVRQITGFAHCFFFDYMVYW